MEIERPEEVGEAELEDRTARYATAWWSAARQSADGVRPMRLDRAGANIDANPE